MLDLCPIENLIRESKLLIGNFLLRLSHVFLAVYLNFFNLFYASIKHTSACMDSRLNLRICYQKWSANFTKELWSSKHS